MSHPILNSPWAYACEPFAVSDHAYYVGNTWVGSYLLDSGDGLILIDCGMPQTVYQIFESIRKLGFDPRDIRLILVSHAHYDHAGGAEAIRQYTGAELYLGKEDLPFIGWIMCMKRNIPCAWGGLPSGRSIRLATRRVRGPFSLRIPQTGWFSFAACTADSASKR